MKVGQWLSAGRAAAGILHGDRVFGGPVIAALGLTNRCNLRCAHCFYYSPLVEAPLYHPLRSARSVSEEVPSREEMLQLRGQDIDPDALDRTVAGLLRMGTRRFQVSGGGEVLLHDGLLPLLQRLKRAGCWCSVTTNGTLLTAESIDAFLAMGLDELRVSVLAGNAADYVATHPGATPDTFNGLREMLCLLSQEKARRGTHRPIVTLILVAMGRNCGGVVEYARCAAEVGAQRALVSPVYDAHDGGLAGVVPGEEEQETLRRTLSEAVRVLEQKGVGHNIALFRKVCDGQVNTSNVYQQIPCYAGWLSTYIRTNGDVHPCCRCAKPFGNIREQPIEEIWQGEAYRRFRRRALAVRRTGAPSQCDCGQCNNYTRNLRTHEALHPLCGRGVRASLPDIF